jgi:hypothetical protein
MLEYNNESSAEEGTQALSNFTRICNPELFHTRELHKSCQHDGHHRKGRHQGFKLQGFEVDDSDWCQAMR